MILTVFEKLLLQRIEKLLKPLSILAITNIRNLFQIINTFEEKNNFYTTFFEKIRYL